MSEVLLFFYFEVFPYQMNMIFIFQVFSNIFVSLKGASGAYSKQEEVVSENMINKNVVGPTITSFSFNNSLASEVKLFLHFASKWIILSEVYFKTEEVNQPVLENKENAIKTIDLKNTVADESESVIQDMPLDDSGIIPENSSQDL